MAYTVVGFSKGTTNTVELQLAILGHGYSRRVPNMKVLGATGDDYELLAERSGNEFANFVLLNEEAVAIGKAVEFRFAPLGTIDENGHALFLFIARRIAREHG
jgi:hypothetical protein